MAVYSGLTGAVDGISSLRTWSINEVDQGPSFGSSANDGMIGQLEGNKDWTGSADVYGYAPAYLPGDTFTFTGFNAEGSHSGSAMVAGVSMTCDIEGGGIISHTINFESDGALTQGTTSATDSGVPAAYSALGCKVAIDAAGGTSFTDVDDVTGWQFSLACATQPYSTTAVSGVRKRKAGQLSGSASYTTKNSATASLPAVGAIISARLHVTASLFYQFRFFRVVSITGNVDVETGAINSQTVNLEFTGFKRITGTMTKGAIVKPDTTNYWS